MYRYGILSLLLIDIQKETLTVNSNMTITGDVILLVDDVSTSGNSLLACKELLIENGKSRYVCIR